MKDSPNSVLFFTIFIPSGADASIKVLSSPKVLLYIEMYRVSRYLPDLIQSFVEALKATLIFKIVGSKERP